MFKPVVVVCALLALGGCVTATNTLNADQVRGFRLAGVSVAYAPNAVIIWGDGERAYAASKDIPVHEEDAAGKTPEGQAYMRGIVSSKVKTAMERTLADQLKGSKPVRVEVVVRTVQIASAVQRIVIGGTHSITADINLVEVPNGKVLLNYPAQNAASNSGQGIAGTLVDGLIGNDPIEHVANDNAAKYRAWLLGQLWLPGGYARGI